MWYSTHMWGISYTLSTSQIYKMFLHTSSPRLQETNLWEWHAQLLWKRVHVFCWRETTYCMRPSTTKSAHLFTDYLSTIHLLTSHGLLDCCEHSNAFLRIRPDNDCNAETPWLWLFTVQISSCSASLVWERLLTLILTVRRKKTYPCANREGMWGNWDATPLILNFGTRGT